MSDMGTCDIMKQDLVFDSQQPHYPTAPTPNCHLKECFSIMGVMWIQREEEEVEFSRDD